MTLRTLLIKLGFKGDIDKLIKFDNKISSLKGNVLGLSAVFASAATMLGYFVNQAAKMERVRISFKVLAGGIQKSKQLLRDILEFAATTPFEIPNVLETTKQLLAFGIKAKDMVETMREVGDVAAGMDKPLNILAQSYGRVMASGRLLGRVLYNLRLQGVPITEYLLKVTGEKSVAAMQKLVSQGKITSDVFAKAWNAMRKERFMNILFEQAQTFLGILSNIKDQVTLLAIAIGDNFLPQFKNMAWYFFEILQRARHFAESPKKMEGIVSKITYLMNLMDKSFVKIYYRLRETIDQFGGINKVLKAFAIIAGTFISIKTLTLIGKLGTAILGIFNIFSHWKLTLLGAGIILLIAAIEDFLGFLMGKESVIGYLLDALENRFPRAFAFIKKWLDIIKDTIESITLFTYGIFKALITGDIKILEKSLEKFSDVYRKIINSENNENVQQEDSKTYRELRKEKLSKMQEEYGSFGGRLAMAPGWRSILEIGKRFQNIGRQFNMPIGPSEWHQKFWQKETLENRILRKGELLHEGLSKLNLSMPLNFNITNNKKTIDEKELAKEISNKVKPIVNEVFDSILKNEVVNLTPKEY